MPLLALGAAETTFADTAIYDGDRAAVVASVGKLYVPGQRYEKGYARHYDESCSATLVTAHATKKTSNLIISAWHCIELYHDTSKPLTFESFDGETRNAQLIASGGSMYSDWALLRLSAPLSHPARLNAPKAKAAKELLMVGYPRRDSGETKILETDTGCRVTGSDGADIRSDCVLQKGASGGAVFTADSAANYLGVISRGDGESQSIYVPLERFHSRIISHFGDVGLP